MKVINLLPKEGQDELKLDQVNYVVRKFWVLVTISLALFLAVGFGVQQYLLLSVSRVEKGIADSEQRLQSADIKEVQDQVLDLNGNLAEISSVRGQQYRWSEVLLELSRIMPEAVQLNSVQLERKTGEVSILGRAQDRDTVIEAWAALKKSQLFRDVNFPLPNLERPTDSNFTYTFFVNLDKIKNNGL